MVQIPTGLEGMKAPWTRLPLFTFFLAAGLMMAGQGLSLPRVTYLGAFALGFTAFVAGIEVIRTKKAFFLPTGAQSLRRHSESYSGVAARLWGVFFALAGFGAMLASVAAMRNFI